MTLLAVYRSEAVSLSTDRLVLAPEELVACHSAIELLQELKSRQRKDQLAQEQAIVKAKTDGYEDGKELAIAEVIPRLLTVIQELEQQSQQDVAALRNAIVTLSLHIVKHIACQLGSSEFVAAMTVDAVNALVRQEKSIVRVHPSVAGAVEKHLLQWSTAGRSEQVGNQVVRADPTLAEFDCIIETAYGQLLAGLNAQLNRMQRALTDGNTAAFASEGGGNG